MHEGEDPVTDVRIMRMGSISAEPFYLFTPLLFAISPQPAGSPKSALGHVAAGAWSRLDTAMMGPTLRRLAWMSLIAARRRDYDAPEARTSSDGTPPSAVTPVPRPVTRSTTSRRCRAVRLH